MKVFFFLLLFSIGFFYRCIAYSGEPEKYAYTFDELTSANSVEARSLVSNGADPNKVDSWGFTLISYLTNYKSAEIMKVWIELGADVDTVNKDGSTPLFLSMYNNSLTKVKLLSKYVKRIDYKNQNGDTALLFAIKGLQIYNPKIVIHLINAGADVNAVDKNGNSALRILRQGETYRWGSVETEIEKLLVSKGARDSSIFSNEKPVKYNRKARKSANTKPRTGTCSEQHSSEENRQDQNCQEDENFNPLH